MMILQGDRITLRVPLDDDATAWFHEFNDTEVMKHIGDASCQNQDYYRKMVTRQRDSFSIREFTYSRLP
jgi:RimJ/RimL family protein N-acetyltransferase